ncbi:MAG: head maturation protease, ClpP-related [Bacillota bacterium]
MPVTNLKSKRCWQFRAAAGESEVGELLLYGPLSSESWWGDEVTPKQFAEELRALGAIRELRIYINSPGGDVFAGSTMYSILSRHSARKVVTVDGLAASAASLVAMAGDRIIMPINAMMMIHNPWMLVVGDAPTLRKAAEDLDKVRESMIAVYHARTGLEPERIAQLLDAETWMTAQDAVDLGFADQVEQAKEVAASVRGTTLVVNGVQVDLRQFRNPPKLLTVRRVYAGVVPEDVSDKKAPEDTPWEAPNLEDFTDKSWDELTDAEKRRIAGHYAWAAEMPPAAFGDLKLPHHRPSDGAIVWRGVTAAAQRLDQTDLPAEDVPKVRRHLERHYHQFGRKAPWEEDTEGRLRLLELELELYAGTRRNEP